MIERDIKNRMDIHGKSAVSLWCANEEQSFENMEALFGSALIAGRRLIEIWDEITLDTLF